MSESQQQQLVIPVVFLGNTYQPQHLLIDIPMHGSQPVIQVESLDALSQEDQDLLREFNLQRVEASNDGDMTIPAFITHEMVELAEQALKIEDQKERRLKLYSLLQMSPQLFPAINEELNTEYKISEDCQFQAPAHVQINGVDKALQLSPYFLKQHVPEFKDQFYQAFEFEELFGDEYDVVSDVLGTFKPLSEKYKQNDVVIPYFPEAQCQDSNLVLDFTLPPGQCAQHFNCLIDVEKIYHGTTYPNIKGTFTDKFVDITRRKMLSTISQKYKGLYLTELQKITEEAKSTVGTDLAVTMLYFDKLDILYTYQLLQQMVGSYPYQAPIPPLLAKIKNNTFGWPVTLQSNDQYVVPMQVASQPGGKQNSAYSGFPAPSSMANIANIIAKVEDLYTQLQQQYKVTNNINEIYTRIFQPTLKQLREERDSGGLKQLIFDIKICQIGKLITTQPTQLQQQIQTQPIEQIELQVIEAQRHYTVIVPKADFDAAGGRKLLNMSLRPNNILNTSQQGSTMPSTVPITRLYDIIKHQINQLRQTKHKLSKSKQTSGSNANYSGNAIISGGLTLPSIPQNLQLLSEKAASRRWKHNIVKPSVIKLKAADQNELLTQKFIYAGKLNTMTIFDLDDFFSICILLAKQDLKLPPFYYDELQGKTSYGSQTAIICPPQRVYCTLLRYMLGNYDFMEGNAALSNLVYIYKNAFMTDKQVLRHTLQPYKILDALDSDSQDKAETPVLKESTSLTSNTKKQMQKSKLQNSSQSSDQLEIYQENFALPELNMSKFDFKDVITDKQTLGDFITEVVDKSNIFSIVASNLRLLYDGQQPQNSFRQEPEQNNCGSQIQQSDHSRNNDSYDQDEESQLLAKTLELYKDKPFDPQIYDEKESKFRPGYILLSSKNLFSESTDDPQSFTYITKIGSFVFDQHERIDECFYRFQNYGCFYNERLANYCAMLLQAIELYANATTRMTSTIRRNMLDDVFSDYYNCRLDALDLSNVSGPESVPLDHWEKHRASKLVLERAHTAPKIVSANHLQRLEVEYDGLQLVTDLFNNSMQFLDYEVRPSNWRTVNALAAAWGANQASDTSIQHIYYQLRSPEAVADTLKEPIVEKEEFHYPLPEGVDPEPEVDMAALKKDQILQKLRTHGGSYKQVPEDMFRRFREQHGELFEIGVYARDPYHVPTSFQETRQLANSVLNHQYFTIPFGSEAGKHMEAHVDLKQDDDINDNGAARYKHQQTAVKSQYIKWITPTGAEAQVCHIEEEQLCFSIYRLRANCLMKVLVAWMATYMPAILKYFDCALTTTQMDAAADIYRMYYYRSRVDSFFQTKYGQKVNAYFYNQDYKYALEKLEFERDELDSQSGSEEAEDDESQTLHTFSDDFDKVIIDYLSLYQGYAACAPNDPFMSMSKINQIQDNWAKGCYAPVQQWPFQSSEEKYGASDGVGDTGSQRDAFPPAPTLPLVLQQFITQIYGTGDILDEMLRCPVSAVPVIARSVQQQIALSKHGEQRAAAVWRNIYPDAYYRSIDHAHVCLQFYDKKLLQQKYFASDIQRRIIDTEMGLNPQQLDSCIDFCLPKCFDVVNFWKYAGGMKLAKTTELQLLLNYHQRQQIYHKFVPHSNLYIPFRASAGQLAGEVFRLMQAKDISNNQRDTSFSIFKRLLSHINSGDQQQFTQEHYKNVFDGESYNEIYNTLRTVQPNAIVTLFMNSEDIKTFTRKQFDKQAQKVSVKSSSIQVANKVDPDKIVYIENVVRDLLTFEEPQEVPRPIQRELYNSEVVSFMNTCMQLLRSDQDGHAAQCKQNLERMMNQRIPIPAVHGNISSHQQVKKNLTMPYTVNRSISMPTVSLRSALIMRSMLLNDTYSDYLLLKIFKQQITWTEFQNIQNEALDEQRKKMHALIKRLANSDRIQQKQQIQTQLQNFQTETTRRLILDHYIIPIIIGLQKDSDIDIQKESYIRYADSDLYATLRFTLVFCYRLEYCFRVIDRSTPEQRQAAVYGTRSMQPIPLSMYNQQVLGTSTFGNPLEEFYEQLTSKTASKSHAESFPLLVSNRVFFGHQPSAQYNNTDPSINDCRCQSVTCAFCGGIGSSYNGTLSGNINPRAANSGYVHMDVDFVNGFDLDEGVMGKKCYGYETEELILRDVSSIGFYWQPQRISLMKRLQPSIPHSIVENPMVGDVPVITQRRHRSVASAENSDNGDSAMVASLERIDKLLNDCSDTSLPAKSSGLNNGRNKASKNNYKASSNNQNTTETQQPSDDLDDLVEGSTDAISPTAASTEQKVSHTTTHLGEMSSTRKKNLNSQNSTPEPQRSKVSFDSMYFGQRLSDTTLNIPPPDVYTQYYYENQMINQEKSGFAEKTPISSKTVEKDIKQANKKNKAKRGVNEVQSIAKADSNESIDDTSKKPNVFVKEYLQHGHFNGIIGRPVPEETLWTQADVFGTEDQILFDDPINVLLMAQNDEILAKYGGVQKFQQFLYAGIELDERFAGTNEQQKEDEIQQLYELLCLFSTMTTSAASKDEYVLDRAYALLGTHAYPLLSLRRTLPGIIKRLESTANKAIAVHFDVITPAYFRCNKAQTATNITISILLYCIQQNLLGFNIAPFHLTQSILNQIYETIDGLYLVECINGFINLQQISPRKPTSE